MASGVREKTRTIVWTRAAGCCQYSGCNESLIGDFISGNEDATFGFIAHIVAREPNGPRGDAVRSPQLVDDPANLMLLCAKHHKLIDVDDPAGHPEARLLGMKDQHERHVRTVLAIHQDRATHVLRYGAKVGEHTSPVAYDLVKTAVLPDRFPAGGTSIAIELRGSAAEDRDDAYWTTEVENLRQQFDRKVRSRIEDGEISHLSVFALAPIPLLVELGRLIGDIGFCSVFQLVREPKGWRWPEAGASMTFTLKRPEKQAGAVALVLSVSAVISPERVYQALGDQAVIWEISANQPNNDVMRSPDDLVAFRQIAREALAAIRLHHPGAEVIHVFPATPVSVSVELGRVWQPKADLPMLIYDERAGVGFVPRVRVERQ